MVQGNRPAIRRVFQNYPIDIVSPNLAEARAVYGELSPNNLLDTMFEDGAQMVALRMGEAGSIVARRSTQERYIVPAVQTSVVDQTGAGNTYCGALLWGILNGLKLSEAAAAAAVAASFCLEQIGILNPAFIPVEVRRQRFEVCKSRILESTINS
jgi:sugar/nucleoside kinase (ribokinase family)